MVATEQKESQRQKQRSLRRILLKEEFVALTGDYMQALILNYFEQRLHNSEDVDEYLAEENARLQQEGQENAQIPPKEGWQRINAPTLAERTMLYVDERSIRRKLSALTESSYLLERNNPDQSWDRTKQYRINLHKIRDDLRVLGYELQGWVLEETPAKPQTANSPDASGILPDRRGTVPDRNSKSASAIQLGSDGPKEKDLPSVGPSGAPTRESSPSDGDAGPTDRPTDGQTEEHSLTNKPEASTTVKLPEPQEPHHERSNATDLSPEENEDNATLSPVEALRQQTEAIPTSEISEDAQSLARKVLADLPALSNRDRCRVARLAEHYHRKGREGVLSGASAGMGLYAAHQRIDHPFPYLLACCVDMEHESSEGDEALLRSLSGEDDSASPKESQPSEYEWFFNDNEEQETSKGEASARGERQHTPEPDPEALAVWEKVLEDVSGEINAPSLRVWFEGTIPISLSADTLTVSVPNSFAKEYIESRFLELLEGALARLSPTSFVEIVVGTESYTNNTDQWNASGKEDG